VVGVRVLRGVVAGLLAGLAVLPGGAARAAGTGGPAQAFEEIKAYDVTVDVQPSGRIHVVETIDYDFGLVPRHGILRRIPVRFRADSSHDRVYPISGVSVSAGGGASAQTERKTSGGYVVIRIGDPNRTISGPHRYVIRYDVDGAVNRFEGHDELYWNAVGNEWPVPIRGVTATVRAAAPIDEAACFAGPKDSRLACRTARVTGRQAVFAQPSLSPYSGLTVVTALPAGYAARPGPILAERWSVDRAFARSGTALGAAALLLLLGLGWVFSLLRGRARDRRFAGEVPGLEPPLGTVGAEEPVPAFGDRSGPVEYTPPEGMRPALMGVLIDESADTLDVTATIVDLAVRRLLRIEELPRQGLFRRRDWRLYRLDGDAAGVTEWEDAVLRGLFTGGRTEVDMSELKNHFHTHLDDVRNRLYDEVVRLGWFTRRPDRVRGRWHAIGVLVVAVGCAVTFVLARWTHLGLAGLPVVVTGVALLAVAKRMPFRTAKGTAALARALGFRRYLATAEAGQLRFEESEGVFARYLPYAVVLGETERWARAFHDLGAQGDLYWYAGPHGWSAADFSDSMDSFAVSASGTLASTPSSSGHSGFSGGSSGGGGGGGGGGSW
jgi:hypothetical protein